jgi:DNA replication licensing factor MCM5
VPTGELPRTVMLVADRFCVNKVTPGTRVTVTGIYSTFRVRRAAAGDAAAAARSPARRRTRARADDTGLRALRGARALCIHCEGMGRLGL